jgi:hypothetical protein
VLPAQLFMGGKRSEETVSGRYKLLLARDDVISQIQRWRLKTGGGDFRVSNDANRRYDDAQKIWYDIPSGSRTRQF